MISPPKPLTTPTAQAEWLNRQRKFTTQLKVGGTIHGRVLRTTKGTFVVPKKQSGGSGGGQARWA